MISVVNILIRNVPAHVLDALRSRARERGRSVQAEALEALQAGLKPMGRSLVEWLDTVADPDIDVELGFKAIREARDER
jgi:plasmid stability protein